MSTARAPHAVAVLISGRGSNLRALIESSREPDCPYRIAAVLSDHADAGGLVIARTQGIETALVEPRAGQDGAAYGRELATEIERVDPALIALAGFMRILPPSFVERFSGRILNVHPSLLPKYPGLRTHHRVLEAGDAEHGATVHFVTAALDAGPPVIQARLAVAAGEDEARLADRVLALEHRIYPLAVRWFCEGRLRCRDGRAWLDGAALAAPVQLDRLEAA